MLYIDKNSILLYNYFINMLKSLKPLPFEVIKVFGECHNPTEMVGIYYPDGWFI